MYHPRLQPSFSATPHPVPSFILEQSVYQMRTCLSTPFSRTGIETAKVTRMGLLIAVAKEDMCADCLYHMHGRRHALLYSLQVFQYIPVFNGIQQGVPAQERVSDITKQSCIKRNNVLPALYAVSLFWGHILQSTSHHHYYEHWHQCCCSLSQGLGHQEGPILHVVCQLWTAPAGLCLLHHAAHQDHSIQPVPAIRRFWFGRIQESCFNLQTVEEIFQCFKLI